MSSTLDCLAARADSGPVRALGWLVKLGLSNSSLQCRGTNHFSRFNIILDSDYTSYTHLYVGDTLHHIPVSW